MFYLYCLHSELKNRSEAESVLAPFVSEQRLKRAERFRSSGDFLRSLLAGGLLRYMLISLCGIGNCEIEFDYNKHGKPLLRGDHGIHFNLTHSGSLIGCAVSSAPVGLDFERIDSSYDYKSASELLHPEERLMLNSLSGEDALHMFFRLWTMKESYLKYLGAGISRPLDGFRISLASGTVADRNSGSAVTVRELHPDCGYSGAICFEKNYHVPEMVVMNEHELFQKVIDLPDVQKNTKIS